ncbi:hypothetical protein NSK_005872 [Nannochloropsis salina CCMP1776]|uniref:Uncharacterized protein n=1 Tax=Nannochloropsis salina CCMP1776 TaxID=1027361 RepID=A0A4D9CV39_9STRA|nr:hypothetical protein NSK_005872 [Nannochloropsis salina CCMP1776]|eukprot:TFJ82796.1 hypothetical protein NSK_005872 [Nannochloropsis salina CCMP1776]
MGLVISRAGKLAPLCMVRVAFVLWLFRSIYAEGVYSLPLNGDSYNILLNATTKGTAALCACLSLLSYLATGVVSTMSATAKTCALPFHSTLALSSSSSCSPASLLSALAKAGGSPPLSTSST